MDWQTAASIASIVTLLFAILGGVYKFGKLNGKVEILWEVFKAEAQESARKRGTLVSSSEYHLTKKGQDMIPPSLKEEIKSLVEKKKLNPSKAQTFEIVKCLGVLRLAYEAQKLGILVQEMIVMVETYIHKEIGE